MTSLTSRFLKWTDANMSLGWNAPVDGLSPANEEWTDSTTWVTWSTAEGLPTGEELTTGTSVVSCWTSVVPAKLGKAAGAGDGTWGSWTAGKKDAGWSCLVTSAATRWTNWSNRAGGKADLVAGIAGSEACKDGPERRTADWAAVSLSLPLDGKLVAAVCLLRGGEAPRDSKYEILENRNETHGNERIK